MKKADLAPRTDAFVWIHQPPDEEKLAQAKRRLKYDELFLMQLGLALRRYRVQHFSKAAPCVCTDDIDSRIRKRFPFLLTADQDTVVDSARRVIVLAEEAGDQASADLGTRRVEIHEKNAWMLRSHLE